MTDPLSSGTDRQRTTDEDLIARTKEAEHMLSRAYSVLMAYGIEHSMNLDRALMMDEIKLHFQRYAAL